LHLINPLEDSAWNELIQSFSNCHFFHTSHWVRVLHESYGYRPVYLAIPNSSRAAIIVPFLEVKSRLTGTRGVALPFTDFCAPLIKNNFEGEILSSICQVGKENSWRYAEIRGGEEIFGSQVYSKQYYFHTLDIDKAENRLFAGLRKNNQRNIKRALNHQLKVGFHHDLPSLQAFYQLNCFTRRRHGLPPQPFHFFKKLQEHIIKKNLGEIALVSYKSKIIAGTIFLYFRKKVIYKYGASLREFQFLRANHLIFWEAIRRYSAQGFVNFHFGRTDLSDQGLRYFKNGWGTEEKLLNYYTIDIGKNALKQTDHQSLLKAGQIFKKLPLPILRFLGKHFYRHMG
jgi:hypothetical protein